MSIDHVLAVVPVNDVDTSAQWYAPPVRQVRGHHPMPTLVEWQVRPGAWVQVFHPGKAGDGLLNLAVGDLDAHIEELRDRGLTPGEVVEANKGVRLSTLSDPDGNQITLIGGFRVTY